MSRKVQNFNKTYQKKILFIASIKAYVDIIKNKFIIEIYVCIYLKKAISVYLWISVELILSLYTFCFLLCRIFLIFSLLITEFHITCPSL